MTSVVVFDYGFGNVRSMVRALANLDLDVTLTSDHRQALEADGLVVPGCVPADRCLACAWASRSCSNVVWSMAPALRALV